MRKLQSGRASSSAEKKEEEGSSAEKNIRCRHFRKTASKFQRVRFFRGSWLLTVADKAVIYIHVFGGAQRTCMKWKGRRAFVYSAVRKNEGKSDAAG
jgi:hypothetical protein